MIDRSDVHRVLTANRYLVLGTADEHGQPWATPVFFAPLDPARVCWVSAPDSRHSRNIAHRTAVAITVFDSTVDVGRGEAAYADADAAPATPDETDAALQPLLEQCCHSRRNGPLSDITAQSFFPWGEAYLKNKELHSCGRLNNGLHKCPYPNPQIL